MFFFCNLENILNAKLNTIHSLNIDTTTTTTTTFTNNNSSTSSNSSSSSSSSNNNNQIHQFQPMDTSTTVAATTVSSPDLAKTSSSVLLNPNTIDSIPNQLTNFTNKNTATIDPNQNNTNGNTNFMIAPSLSPCNVISSSGTNNVFSLNNQNQTQMIVSGGGTSTYNGNLNSPHSPPLPSSFKNNSIMNNNQCSPISTSPASNAMMGQQFSPFISEDDSSEINDISPSPIGACGKLFFVFAFFLETFKTGFISKFFQISML